jgi:hypothetical protein
MFGSNGDLQGNITVTSIQDNTTGLSTGIATLMGDFTTTLSSGALASAFPVGSKATFNLPLQTSDGRFPSVESAFERPLSFGSFPNTTFTPSGLSGPATITPVAAPPEIPLPPALYLFGSVLGGAFWLGRRKRSAVSSLGV